MTFRFLTHIDMVAGNGLFRTIPAFLRERRFQKPAFLVDAGFARSSLWLEVEKLLRAEFGKDFWFHLNPGAAEPTYDSLRDTLQVFRKNIHDVIVGVGGGSCMDTAKAVAALQTNHGDPLDYRGFDKLQVPGVPTVLVPTTAGTGSEAAFNASFVDLKSNRKMGINGRYMFPTWAMLDGEATVTCPYGPALSAGVDALVHTLEGFACKQRNPMSDMLVRKAFTLLVNALPSLKTDPKNLTHRLDLLLGAHLGGMIQMNSGSGVAAAISYPLSVYYKVPHGIGGGMFCPDVIKFNIDAGFTLYSELAPLIGLGSSDASAETKARLVLSHIKNLWHILEVPSKLSVFGIGPEQFDNVLKVMGTQQAAFDQNPVPFTIEEHLAIFLKPFILNG